MLLYSRNFSLRIGFMDVRAIVPVELICNVGVLGESHIYNIKKSSVVCRCKTRNLRSWKLEGTILVKFIGSLKSCSCFLMANSIYYEKLQSYLPELTKWNHQDRDSWQRNVASWHNVFQELKICSSNSSYKHFFLFDQSISSFGNVLLSLQSENLK